MVHHITVENVYCSSLTLVLLLKLLTRFTGLAQALCSTEEADSGGNSSATLNICPLCRHTEQEFGYSFPCELLKQLHTTLSHCCLPSGVWKLASCRSSFFGDENFWALGYQHKLKSERRVINLPSC